jgi:polysaccharide export outer membrane protein
VVNVERRESEPIHVRGLVRKPDRYEYPVSENMHVLDAISLAGGESMTVANKVYIIRRDPESNELVVIKTSLGKAKRDSRANLILAPGDIVSLESTPMTALLETLSIIRFGIGASLPINTLY